MKLLLSAFLIIFANQAVATGERVECTVTSAYHYEGEQIKVQESLIGLPVYIQYDKERIFIRMYGWAEEYRSIYEGFHSGQQFMRVVEPIGSSVKVKIELVNLKKPECRANNPNGKLEIMSVPISSRSNRDSKINTIRATSCFCSDN